MRLRCEARECERRLSQLAGVAEPVRVLKFGIGGGIEKGRAYRGRGAGATVYATEPNPETEAYYNARRQQDCLSAEPKSGYQSTYPGGLRTTSTIPSNSWF